MISRLLLLALSICLTASPLLAQLGGWSHRMPVQLTEEAGQNLGGIPVLLIVDTQTPIAAGQMQASGDDIRIADSCGTTRLPLWIESGLNTDSTRIWTRIPGLSANDSTTWYLYHGHPTAASASTFSSVFSLSYESQGNDTLGGPHVYQSFEVKAGDTLFIQEGAELTIFARRFRLDGVVMGNGKGFAPPGLGMAGNGFGGGGTSFNAGAGGGGYGGKGGTGGYDFADTPGAGGVVNGTDYGPDIGMGSAGGSSDLRLGGAGGGSLAIYAEAVDITGDVWCNGLDASQVPATRGAGGGAGGGILISGKYLTLSGLMAVNGGDGTFGSTTANDDGGGGGGGRIKLFWEDFLWNLGQISALGGLGGPNGSQAAGENGDPGAIRDSMKLYPTVAFEIGPSIPSSLPPNPSLIPIPDPICPGEPIAFALPAGYSNYAFFQSNTLMQDSSLNSWTAGMLADGTTIRVDATYGACTMKDTLVIQSVSTQPVSIVASDSTVCIGDTVILDAGSGWSAYLWSNGDTTATTEVDFSGFFSVEVRDSNNCPVRDTYVVNLGPPPIPQINVSGLPACEGSPVTLTTGSFADYQWSNGGTSQSTVVNASGTYTVTVTNANGCTNDASLLIALDTLPVPSIIFQNDSLLTDTGYATYQWLWNGSPLSNADTFFHVPAFNGGYSVIVTDGNGCAGQSATSQVMVGIAGGSDGWVLRLAPNPSQGRMRLQGSLGFPARVGGRVLDAVGRLVWVGEWDFSSGDVDAELDFEGLPSGVYSLLLEGDGEVQWRKLLKFVLE